MCRSMQLLYSAYAMAFLQTELFLLYLFFCDRKALPVLWRSGVNFLWLVMGLPWQSHIREIRFKNKSVNGNTVTGIYCSCMLLLIGSWSYVSPEQWVRINKTVSYISYWFIHVFMLLPFCYVRSLLTYLDWSILRWRFSKDVTQRPPCQALRESRTYPLQKATTTARKKHSVKETEDAVSQL